MNMFHYDNFGDEETAAQTSFNKFVSSPAIKYYNWNSNPVVSDFTVHALYVNLNRVTISYYGRKILSKNTNFKIIKEVDK